MFKCLSIFILFLLFSSFSYAQTELTVTINVGDTILTLSGKTSPQAQITIVEGGAVVGTTAANSQGSFRKSLLAQTPGVHSIGIYSTDTDNVSSSTVIYSVSLTALQETTLSNIVLPPTINLSGTEVAKGDTIDIYGMAVPSSIITIFITGGSTITTSSGGDGSWKYTYDTDNLIEGNTYNVYAKVSTTTGYQSEASKTQSFKIKAAVATKPLLPSMIAFFDIDGSGRIELTEIFEVVKRWVDVWRGEGELKNGDLNGDGNVNLVDFSVLLYYIGR